ncbi:phosphatase PAP2 family protein [Streptomyces hoynatensis]|uniref:Phosphatase PAP2 family protein n=1 Tax=Streptomyces hoynatensis TaxID=1141874 RepID=A0A3A9ZIT7_9ACTN|nr:phosphatase PAP2 family protein [Streptomyces hoynatensis]
MLGAAALWVIAAFLVVRAAVAALRRPAEELDGPLPGWAGTGGGSLYAGEGDDRFAGTPLDGLLVRHLGGGSAVDSHAVWTCFLLLLLAAAAVLATRAAPGRRPWHGPFAVCLLTLSLPVRELLGRGQLALVLPALLALGGWLLATAGPNPRPVTGRSGALPGAFENFARGGWGAHAEGRRLAGGALLGLAAAAQPVLLLLAVPLWAAGRRRGALAAGVAFGCATAVGWLALPGDSVTYWLRNAAGAGLAAAPGEAGSQSLHSALLRQGLHGPGERVLCLALALAVCAVALRRAARYCRDGQPLPAAAVAGCATLALAPAAWPHEQLWLLLAAQGRWGRRTADRPVWPVFVALVAVVEGAELLPKLDWLAVFGENLPLIAALLAACAVPFLPRSDPRWAAPEAAGPAGRPNLLLELVLIRAGYAAYSWIRSYAKGDRHTAERHGHQVLDVQEFLHVDIEHWLNHTVAKSAALADAMDFYYATFHFVVPLSLLGWLLVRHPADYRQARAWLGCTTLFGLVGFWLYPLAPPRLMPGLGFIDTANGPQDLNDPRFGALTGITNPYAAMPSLHVGWALWCALTLWRVAPYAWLRLAGFAYPVLTAAVVMGTANHYLLDAVGGVAVVAAGYAVTRAVTRLLQAPRPAGPPGPPGPPAEPVRPTGQPVPQRG